MKGRAWLAFGLTVLFAWPAAAQEPEARPLVITVRPRAFVPEGPVLVSHVATLTGGDTALRQRVAALDVADPPAKGAQITLLRELIAYRLQIAGIDRARFRMEGPMQLTVSRAPVVPGADNPVLIKPRDVVTLTARVGGVRLVTRGEALQEGRAGDRVRVRNIDSKREVVGRVVERGVVEVDF